MVYKTTVNGKEYFATGEYIPNTGWDCIEVDLYSRSVICLKSGGNMTLTDALDIAQEYDKEILLQELP